MNKNQSQAAEKTTINKLKMYLKLVRHVPFEKTVVTTENQILIRQNIFSTLPNVIARKIVESQRESADNKIFQCHSIFLCLKIST